MGADRDEHLKGSEHRLWSLIEARAEPGADTAKIDQRIWDLFGEEWAVMFTDLSGFSRQVADFGIIHFLQIIHEQKALLLPIVGHHDGILIKIEADSFLVIFKRPAGAVRCAIEMQRACQALYATQAPERRILLCVGIGHGQILRIGDQDVWGQEVNAASKLGEDSAKADEILITDAVKRAVEGLDGLTFEPFGHAVPGSATNWYVNYPRALTRDVTPAS